MKYILFIIVGFTYLNGCNKQNNKNINLCLEEKRYGWFYVFITNDNRGLNTGECLSFDNDNVLVIPKSWLTDSAQINLYRGKLNFNDSAYFFTQGEFQSKNKNLYTYYCFYINDTLKKSYLFDDKFKENEYFIKENMFDAIIAKYNIK